MLMRYPESLNGKYAAIKKKIDNDYSSNNALWQIYWTQASIDTRLEAGDVSLLAEVNASLPNNQNGQWFFNRVRPICNNVSGYQRRNRKSTIAVPVENGDQHTADQWTKILLHIYKKENVYGTISDAFHQGACLTGLNLLHVYVDYREDPVNGDIKVDNLPYNCFLVDPYFRKADLSDAMFVWRRSYLTHSVAASLMPQENYDEIMALQGNQTGMAHDSRFEFMPESQGQTSANKLAYDEYFYRDSREQKLLVDKETGDILDVSNQDNIDIDLFLDFNPQVRLITQQIPTVRMAIMIQDRIFYDGPSGLDRYPFIPVIGYYSPSLPYFYNRIQGICRSLRDPQMLLNRRIILSADILESQLNSGFIFKENAPVDVSHLFQTGQGRVIPLKENAQMSDIIQIQPPQIPPSIFELQKTFSDEMNFVSGVSQENLGQIVDDNASGFKSALRQGAGLTGLQPIFDRLDSSQNLLGEVMMELIRTNYTPGKIQKMLGGEQPAPLFYNKAFGKYKCTVELGFDTETQRQMQFAQLLDLQRIGINIPPKTLIDAATLQRKDELIKDIEQNMQQAQQTQQAQMELQMEELKSRTELSRARAQADAGLGIERMSRVAENQALAQERKSEAVKDDQQALLNYVKALKEIENIDLDQLQKLISLKKMLNVQSEQNPGEQTIS